MKEGFDMDPTGIEPVFPQCECDALPAKLWAQSKALYQDFLSAIRNVWRRVNRHPVKHQR